MRGRFLVQPKYSWHEDHYMEPMDLSQRRPVINLEGSVFQEKYGKSGYSLIGNLYHGGQFWIARVPVHGVLNIYPMISYFPPNILGWYPAAHDLLRVEMDPQRPIELVALMPSETQVDSWERRSVNPSLVIDQLPEISEDRIIRLRNIAISTEATWTQNDPFKAYSLVRGSRGAFLNVVRVVSMEERFLQTIQSGDYPTSQIQIPRSVGDVNKVCAVGFKKSQIDGLSRVYDTLFNNCVIAVFDILEAALDLKDGRLGYIRSFTEKRVPFVSHRKFRYYGGIDAPLINADESLTFESAMARLRCEIALNAR